MPGQRGIQFLSSALCASQCLNKLWQANLPWEFSSERTWGTGWSGIQALGVDSTSANCLSQPMPLGNKFPLTHHVIHSLRSEAATEICTWEQTEHGTTFFFFHTIKRDYGPSLDIFQLPWTLLCQESHLSEGREIIQSQSLQRAFFHPHSTFLLKVQGVLFRLLCMTRRKCMRSA